MIETVIDRLQFLLLAVNARRDGCDEETRPGVGGRDSPRIGGRGQEAGLALGRKRVHGQIRPFLHKSHLASDVRGQIAKLLSQRPHSPGLNGPAAFAGPGHVGGRVRARSRTRKPLSRGRHPRRAIVRRGMGSTRALGLGSLLHLGHGPLHRSAHCL